MIYFKSCFIVFQIEDILFTFNPTISERSFIGSIILIFLLGFYFLIEVSEFYREKHFPCLEFRHFNHGIVASMLLFLHFSRYFQSISILCRYFSCLLHPSSSPFGQVKLWVNFQGELQLWRHLIAGWNLAWMLDSPTMLKISLECNDCVMPG